LVQGQGQAAGAVISVARTNIKAIADVEGRYLLPALPEGRFDLVVFQPGFKPARLMGVSVRPALNASVQAAVLVPADTATVTISGSLELLGRDSATAGQVIFFNEQRPSQTYGPVNASPDGRYTAALPRGCVSRAFCRRRLSECGAFGGRRFRGRRSGSSSRASFPGRGQRPGWGWPPGSGRRRYR